MLNTPTTMDLPLHTDTDGVLRIGNTRITLHTLITTYKLGESPADVHDAYPNIELADIYMVIAYYLANREAVDSYIAAIDEQAEKQRQATLATQPQPTKAELQKRLKTNQSE